MDRLAQLYKDAKPNQKLVWLLSQGRITLELDQRDPAARNATVTVSFDLSLFAASVVLFVKDLTLSSPAVSVEEVAGRLGVSAAVLQPHLVHLIPSALVQTSRGLTLQKHVVSAGHYVFDEAEEEENEEENQISPEQAKVLQRMIMAMVKTRGAQTANDIHNSMKMFGQFSGTVADMKQFLQKIVSEGTLTLADGRLYGLPPK